jgi:hypothetical protein
MQHDPEYLDMVHRYRHGNQDAVKDEAYLKARQLNATNTLRTGHLSELHEDPVIIVDSNLQRYQLNLQKATDHAKATKQKLFFSVAVDKCTKRKMSNKLRYDLLLLPDGTQTNYAAGLLPLCLGMPVILKGNMGTEVRCANGTIGTILKITLDPREVVDRSPENIDTPHYLRYQPVLEVHFPDAEDHLHLDGLLKGVMPISNTFGYQTRKSSFKYDLRTSGTTERLQVTRTQLWILPAFAITVNSSQGRSLDSAIVDLSKQKPGKKKNEPGQAQKSYVKLSRLRTGKYLGIQGTWLPALWKTQPDPAVINYIDKVLVPIQTTTIQKEPTIKMLEASWKRLNNLVTAGRRAQRC